MCLRTTLLDMQLPHRKVLKKSLDRGEKWL
jgi:hypothetical protein